MIVKSFTAESSAAALKLVREQMGGDAIVLRTVQMGDAPAGQQVEITACLERPSVAQTDILLATEKLAVATEAVANDAVVGGRLAAMEEKLDRLVASGSSRVAIADDLHDDDLSWLRDRFQAADLPTDFARELLNTVEQTLKTVGDFDHIVKRVLHQAIDRMVQPGIEIEAGARVAFVGPAGMGKSSVMGKLAARLVFEDHLKVRLANLNSIKLAAHEEVAGYAAALGADFVQAENIDADDTAVTLYDCAGLPNHPQRLDNMQLQLSALQPTHCVAVLSSLGRTGDIVRLADNLASLNPTHLAVAMLDQSQCYGPAIALAQKMSIRISLGTDAPGGLGSLLELDSDSVVEAILAQEDGDA